MDKRGFADLLLTDLSKAFDYIDHELLIAKLHAEGFNIKSLELIHSYLYDQIQRTRHSIFSIYTCDLFFDIIELDIANYTDDTTPYALDSKRENIIQLLRENADKAFVWFSNKASPEKCHLLVDTTGSIRISARKYTISNSSNQKLL